MDVYRNKKVLVVGLGRSGLAAARFLSRAGARVMATDNRPASLLQLEINGLAGLNIEFVLGSNPPEIFSGQDLIVLSPGVPLDIPGLDLARSKATPVVCEIELGLPLLKGDVVGITGTNGKSTTTALVGEYLKALDSSTWVGGNIGKPLVGGIEDAMIACYVVLELSSYQLEITPSLKPAIAVWLNAAPDHLDRYNSFTEYVDAKALIGRNQSENDWILYNADDELVSKKISKYRSNKVAFSVSKKLKGGAWYESEYSLRLVSEKSAVDSGFDFSVDTSGAKIKGRHNAENIAAASLAGAIFGLSKEGIETVLGEFEGLPHRLQFVREKNGVSYYNDSKGTNAHAVLKSLESFERPVVLIAGGLDKNTGYADLLDIARRRVRHIFAIGEAAEKIKKELGGATKVTICVSMEDAVKKASVESVDGDVVLLSPACASFDMFKDYADRGNEFVRCVRELK